MVGIVIVSHSEKVAEGASELAALMAPEVRMRAAGGIEDGGFGTSFDKIYNAIEQVYSDDGVVVIMDMGSSVMTTQSVIEEMNDEKNHIVKMADCPIVEGTVAAAVAASCGMGIDEVINAAENSKAASKF